MDEERAHKVRELLFEIIENQMKDGSLPEVEKTYQRLLAQGFSRDETMKLMATVVITELNDMVKEDRTFDEEGYVEALKALPQLPYDDDEPED